MPPPHVHFVPSWIDFPLCSQSGLLKMPAGEQSFEYASVCMLLSFAFRIKLSLANALWPWPPLQLRFSAVPLDLCAPATWVIIPSLSVPYPSHVWVFFLPLPTHGSPFCPLPFKCYLLTCPQGPRLNILCLRKSFLLNILIMPQTFPLYTHDHCNELIIQLTNITLFRTILDEKYSHIL